MNDGALIVARAPTRISFAGGGTDLPAFYERDEGLVVSAAINRYVYVMAKPTADRTVKLASTNLSQSRRFPAGQRPPVDGGLAYLAAAVERYWENGVRQHGLDLTVYSEVDPGTGLGSSSATLVALVAALTRFSELPVARARTAEAACELELDRLGKPIGKQDHYASALGGVNMLRFSANGIAVEPLRLLPGVANQLCDWLLLFCTGTSHDSAQILAGQHRALQSRRSVFEGLCCLRDLAMEVATALERGDLETFGTLLDEGWQIKRRLSPRISTASIDAAYEAARDSGVLGGKLCGAGGAGYLLLCCHPAAHRELRNVMRRHRMRELRFGFDFRGVRVIVDAEVGQPNQVAS